MPQNPDLPTAINVDASSLTPPVSQPEVVAVVKEATATAIDAANGSDTATQAAVAALTTGLTALTEHVAALAGPVPAVVAQVIAPETSALIAQGIVTVMNKLRVAVPDELTKLANAVTGAGAKT